MSKRMNAKAIELHQARQGIVERLSRVLRTLGGATKHPGRSELFSDMACRLGKQTISPSDSYGFIVTNTTLLARGRGVSEDAFCLYQVVRTAVMYLNLFDATKDFQDLRSCRRYIEWLEQYVECPSDYGVVGNVRHGWYLWNRTQPGAPHPPEWLQENDRETI